MPVTVQQLNAFDRLNAFMDFAKTTTDAKTLVHFNQSTRTFSVAEGDHIRTLFSPGTAGRNLAANNETRTAFKNALLDLFGRSKLEQLPKVVRNALKSGDFNGTGKPLSARRISAVMTAVTNTVAFKNAQQLQTANVALMSADGSVKNSSFGARVKDQWNMVAKGFNAQTTREQATLYFSSAFKACKSMLDGCAGLKEMTPEQLFETNAKEDANSSAVANFKAALAGWKFGDEKEVNGKQVSEKRERMCDIFRCMTSVAGLIANGSRSREIVTPMIVDFVAYTAQKMGFITGMEKPQSTYESQQMDGTKFKTTISKGETKAFKLDSAFKKNKTSEFPGGVCLAATTLWLERHIRGTGDPQALKPEDCNRLQREVEKKDGTGFTFIDVAQVKAKTGGTLDGFGDMAPLKMDKQVNVNLKRMLDELPVKGFVYLQAEKGRAAHSMAIFKESEDKIHFFNPGEGMYASDTETMVDIITHNMSGWTQVTCQPGHVEELRNSGPVQD